MGNTLRYMFLGVLTSFYIFPISFTFIPQTLNTKMMLGMIGVVFISYQSLRKDQLIIKNGVLGTLVFSFAFSLFCFISTDLNNTWDYAYATYILSVSVWLFGAYALCIILRHFHGQVTFRLVTYYATAVCVAQCIAALSIDNIPSFQLLIDNYVAQGQEFFEEVDRLYGIGAALDPAGVRFSVVLIMIVALLNHDTVVRRNTTTIILLILSFFIITVVGNIISRTTILGVACAGLYLLVSSGIFTTIIRKDALKLASLFFGLLLVTAIVTTILYQTNDAFHNYLRFAFEGFFNWVEQGEWRTDSTDKLNREMWVWPNDLQTWLIGSGLFNNFIYGTDIGYCRFILYCGLIGFSVFALLFIYLPLSFAKEHRKYYVMFLLFMVLSFMIWVKVATDIFQFYALLLCLDTFVKEDLPLNQSYENSVLHTRYV